MTDEEKKEFEEFLKWKADKAKLAASKEIEESPASPLDVEDNEAQKDVVSQPDSVLNSDANKEINNTGLYILAAVMVIVLLFTLVIALSNSKQSNLSTTESVAEIEEDTVAVALPDDEVTTGSNKATWNFTIAKDDMYDTNNIWAEIKSDNYVSQRFPYEGYTYATITVRYMKKYVL